MEERIGHIHRNQITNSNSFYYDGACMREDVG
jgi:hypothetical protein